eukprot:EG_transcript_22780
MVDRAFGVLVSHVSNLPLDFGQQVQLFWACGKEEGCTCPVPVGHNSTATFNYHVSLRPPLRKAREAEALGLNFCLQKLVRLDVGQVVEKWALSLGDATGSLGVTSSKGITLTLQLFQPPNPHGSPLRRASSNSDPRSEIDGLLHSPLQHSQSRKASYQSAGSGSFTSSATTSCPKPTSPLVPCSPCRPHSARSAGVSSTVCLNPAQAPPILPFASLNLCPGGIV